MPEATPVIIEAAVNGFPISPNQNRPFGPEAVAADALRCIEAGAAIIHTHVDPGDTRKPANETAEHYLAQFSRILAARPDALVYPTVGSGDTIADRMAHHEALVESCGLRIGLIDPGSLNLTTADAEGLPSTDGIVYANSPADIHYIFGLLARLQLGPSMAIYEPTFLRYALSFQRAGKLPPGSLAKFYFGEDFGPSGLGQASYSFGLPPRPWALDAYLKLLEGYDLPWAVTVLGGDVTEHGLARYALEKGGHVRVGLEDYAGPNTPSNLELVEQVVKLASEVGRPVATPDEAAAILGLPRGRSPAPD
jgi:uncharacterized protein (DUF849 family)